MSALELPFPVARLPSWSLAFTRDFAPSLSTASVIRHPMLLILLSVEDSSKNGPVGAVGNNLLLDRYSFWKRERENMDLLYGYKRRYLVSLSL